MARAAGYYLRRFDSFRADRAQYDQKWQMVSDYVLPRRDFSITPRKNQLRPHRVTSSVATNANSRMAAFLLSYWLDPSRPFLSPNVSRGLAIAGRPTGLDDNSIRYLDALSWGLFDNLMRPKARLMLSVGSMLQEFCAFGCGVLWIGRRRGFGPTFAARSLGASWWSENHDGIIDTLYYKLSMPLYRVIEQWPGAASIWPNFEAEKQTSQHDQVEILICCEPRPGGRAGAVAEAKPFEYVVLAVQKAAILEQSGYDSFPYMVFRYDTMPGQTYAEGPGCKVLADVMVLNHLVQAIENSASQKAEPPIAYPMRMFGRPLDRRPGAVNHYNPANLGLMKSAQDAIAKLDLTGDPADATRHVIYLTQQIETGYFVDWQTPRETGDQTATEINDRRDIRLRGAASIVANMEEPTSLLGDRVQEIMTAEGMVAPPPAALGKVEVDWEYAGPLAVAQLEGNARAILQWMNARGLVAGQDPDAAMAADLEESLRVLHTALALPPNTLNSHDVVTQARAARQQAQEQAANAQKLALVAKAASDGANAAHTGVAAEQAANAPPPGGPPPGGPGGQGAAPFAPASPFAGAGA